MTPLPGPAQPFRPSFSCPTCHRTTDFFGNVVERGDFEREDREYEIAPEATATATGPSELERDQAAASDLPDCASGHERISMQPQEQPLPSARWYRCPRCSTRKLHITEALLDEGAGKRWLWQMQNVGEEPGPPPAPAPVVRSGWTGDSSPHRRKGDPRWVPRAVEPRGTQSESGGRSQRESEDRPPPAGDAAPPSGADRSRRESDAGRQPDEDRFRRSEDALKRPAAALIRRSDHASRPAERREGPAAQPETQSSTPGAEPGHTPERRHRPVRFVQTLVWIAGLAALEVLWALSIAPGADLLLPTLLGILFLMGAATFLWFFRETADDLSGRESRWILSLCLLAALVCWFNPDLRILLLQDRARLIQWDYLPRLVGALFFLWSGFLSMLLRSW